MISAIALNTMVRLVEKELEDRRLWVVAGLLAYSLDPEGFDDGDDFLTRQWQPIIKTLSEYPAWKNGGHEGDCTKVPATCNRCFLEGRVDEARQLIEKHLGGKV